MKRLSLSNNLTMVAAKDGVFLTRANDSYIGGAIALYGEYCRHEVDLCCSLVKPGHCVIDVGASIGAFTVPLAKAVGPQGTAYAYEANPKIYRHLMVTLTLNELDNVVAYEAWGIDPVPSLPCRLIKIDVDGAEPEVLHKARKLIMRDRPLMYVECDRPDEYYNLMGILRELRYRTFWHTPLLFNPGNHFGTKENAFGNKLSFNLLCVPRERPEEMPKDMLECVSTLYPHPLAHNEQTGFWYAPGQ